MFLMIREAILQKIPEFYENFSQRGGVYRILYLLFRNIPQNQWRNLNKDFINAVQGGGHRFMKLFHKIPLFFERWLPLLG